jgi:hypothetical protein
MLTATAGNAAFNPRASVPASSSSALLPSAAAAVAAQSAMQQRFSTQTGSLFVFVALRRLTPLQPCCAHPAPAAAPGACALAAPSFEPCRCVSSKLHYEPCFALKSDVCCRQGVGFSATASPVAAVGAPVPAKGAWRAQR